MVTEIFDAQQKKQIAAEILQQLPDWFGLPESTKRYIEESAGMPFWAWCEAGEEACADGENGKTQRENMQRKKEKTRVGGEDECRKGEKNGKANELEIKKEPENADEQRNAKNPFSGFLALKETSPHTAEIYVMGVLQKRHRKGIGRKLYLAFENYAREKGYSFLQVKTVQSGHYEEYDRTNGFYQAMGFRELECLPTLWDGWNPCQIYVKYIEP